MTTERTQRVLVAVIGWRNARYAADFVRSLQVTAASEPQVDLHIVCVSNGPDGEHAAQLVVQALAVDGLTCRTVSLPENEGYAGGMQAALAAVDVDDYDIFILANLDGAFQPDFFTKLLACAGSRSRWGMLVPTVIGPSGATCGLREDFLGRFRKADTPPAADVPVQGGTGACMVLSSDYVNGRIHDFGVVLHPEYHSYYEDQELFLWARQTDLPAYACPEAVFSHVHGGSHGGKYRLVDKDDAVFEYVMANYLVNRWLYTRGVHRVVQSSLGLAVFLAVLLRNRPRRAAAISSASLRRARRNTAIIRGRQQARLRSRGAVDA